MPSFCSDVRSSATSLNDIETQLAQVHQLHPATDVSVATSGNLVEVVQVLEPAEELDVSPSRGQRLRESLEVRLVCLVVQGGVVLEDVGEETSEVPGGGEKKTK